MTIRTPGNKYRSTEHDEQVALIEWAALHRTIYPELDLLFAIPNGGKRHIGTAKKLKAEGVKPGVPDLFLPVARGEWHGLFIEMKRTGGKVSPDQWEMIEKLAHQRYRVIICYSWIGAKDQIIDYLIHTEV